MIEPNFDLLLWIIFIFYGVSGLANIAEGALGNKKPETYGINEVAAGLVMLFVCFVVCIF